MSMLILGFMKKLLLVALMGLVAVPGLTTTTVFAASPDANGHYYQGGSIGPSFWVGTNNSTGFATWIEAGYRQGWNSQNMMMHYWTHLRPGYIYFEHKATSIMPWT